MDIIKQVMGSYKETLVNLTNEITNLREQVADQKTDFKKQWKLINQQRNQHQQQIENQLKEQQKHQQQQQHQMKNQLKQQFEQQIKLISSTETAPQVEIQYEQITVPPREIVKTQKQQQPKQQQKKNVSTNSSLRQDTPLETSPCSTSQHLDLPRPAKAQVSNNSTAMIFGSSIVRHVNSAKHMERCQNQHQSELLLRRRS